MNTPDLKTSKGRLNLRAMSIYDAIDCTQWLHDYNVNKFSEQRHRWHDLKSQKKYIKVPYGNLKLKHYQANI